jgi:hypothetical protein
MCCRVHSLDNNDHAVPLAKQVPTAAATFTPLHWCVPQSWHSCLMWQALCRCSRVTFQKTTTNALYKPHP